MTRRTKRASTGRFAPADIPDADDTVNDHDTSPDTVHVIHGQEIARTSAPVELAYSGPGRADRPSKYDFDPFTRYHGHGGTNPHLGRAERATHSDSAGVPVAKPKQGRSSMFLSPATNAIVTRAEKDAGIVHYARVPEDLGENY